MNYDFAFLIILYNCELNDSNTIKSLLNSNFDFNNVKITIVNNGPNELRSCNHINGIDIELIQDTSNRALSVIYNEFIQNNISKFFVILDHDSILTDEYINDLGKIRKNFQPDINIPSIYSGSLALGPKVDGKVISGPNINKHRLIGIGSGIVFSKNISTTLQKKYGSVFDENFFFYGVDSSFFLRLRRENLTRSINIIGPLQHSLSRLEIESSEVMSFRNKERSYDLGLTIRYYFSLEYLARFLLLIFCKSFNRGKYKHLIFKDVISAILHGKHYRSI